jgi:shikimate kinase
MSETMEPGGPTLLVLVGPPAVGKMTVGRAIAARTSLSLFHNHMAIDLAAQFFEIGSGPFRRIVRDVRQRVMEEAAENLPGLIFTYVFSP